MIRKFLLFAAVSIVFVWMAAHEYLANAAGRTGAPAAAHASAPAAVHASAPAGGGARSVDGGSFSRPAAPAAVARSSAGQNFGARVPSKGNAARPPAQAIVRNAPVKAPNAYPKTSIPAFVAPARRTEPNIVRAPAVERAPTVATQPVRPGGVSSVPSVRAPGAGFIKLPGGPGNVAASPRSPFVPTQRTAVARPGLATAPKLTRGLGSAAPVGLGNMPAIQQHLQKRGQTLQTWSASRDQGLNQWHQQNAPRLAQFQQSRETQWSHLNGNAADHLRMARGQGADWQNYRRDVQSFRTSRADEVRDRIRDGYDDLFTYDWWNEHQGRNFPLGDYSPWWWWNTSPWNAVAAFGAFDSNQPTYYDYDNDAVMGDDVYIDGQDMGPDATYAQQMTQLANPAVPVEEPAPVPSADQPDEWQPFGVFALTQEEKGDAVMFFQLAMNKEGLISGAFTNTLTGDSAAVTGSVDRATQKAAWHVGDKTDTVYEAGVANLTQSEAPVLVHFGAQTTQTWLLVHLASPDLPIAPAAASAATSP